MQRTLQRKKVVETSKDQFKIESKPSPNFTAGRKGNKIIAIVDHITAGLMPGCLSWMCNPVAKASAHYLVTRQGKIYQLVKDADTAWHAGAVNRPNWALYSGGNPNHCTLGIEHEGYREQSGDGNLTEMQYQASLWLHKQLINKYNLPIDDNHILGHYRIDSVNRPNCPGPNFPWNQLFSDLKRKDDDMFAKLKLDTNVDLPEVKVKLNGTFKDKCVLLNVDNRDTTYIPAVILRDIGINVTWDNATKTVIIGK